MRVLASRKFKLILAFVVFGVFLTSYGFFNFFYGYKPKEEVSRDPVSEGMALAADPMPGEGSGGEYPDDVQAPPHIRFGKITPGHWCKTPFNTGLSAQCGTVYHSGMTDVGVGLPVAGMPLAGVTVAIYEADPEITTGKPSGNLVHLFASTETNAEGHFYLPVRRIIPGAYTAYLTFFSDGQLLDVIRMSSLFDHWNEDIEIMLDVPEKKASGYEAPPALFNPVQQDVLNCDKEDAYNEVPVGSFIAQRVEYNPGLTELYYDIRHAKTQVAADLAGFKLGFVSPGGRYEPDCLIWNIENGGSGNERDAWLCDPRSLTYYDPGHTFALILSAADKMTPIERSVLPFYRFIPKLAEITAPRRFESRVNIKHVSQSPVVAFQTNSTALGTALSGALDLRFRLFDQELEEDPLISCDCLKASTSIGTKDQELWAKCPARNNFLSNGPAFGLAAPFLWEQLFKEPLVDLKVPICSGGDLGTVTRGDVQVPWEVSKGTKKADKTLWRPEYYMPDLSTYWGMTSEARDDSDFTEARRDQQSLLFRTEYNSPRTSGSTVKAFPKGGENGESSSANSPLVAKKLVDSGLLLSLKGPFLSVRDYNETPDNPDRKYFDTSFWDSGKPVHMCSPGVVYAENIIDGLDQERSIQPDNLFEGIADYESDETPRGGIGHSKNKASSTGVWYTTDSYFRDYNLRRDISRQDDSGDEIDKVNQSSFLGKLFSILLGERSARDTYNLVTNKKLGRDIWDSLLTIVSGNGTLPVLKEGNGLSIGFPATTVGNAVLSFILQASLSDGERVKTFGMRLQGGSKTPTIIEKDKLMKVQYELSEENFQQAFPYPPGGSVMQRDTAGNPVFQTFEPIAIIGGSGGELLYQPPLPKIDTSKTAGWVGGGTTAKQNWGGHDTCYPWSGDLKIEDACYTFPSPPYHNNPAERPDEKNGYNKAFNISRTCRVSNCERMEVIVYCDRQMGKTIKLKKLGIKCAGSGRFGVERAASKQRSCLNAPNGNVKWILQCLERTDVYGEEENPAWGPGINDLKEEVTCECKSPPPEPPGPQPPEPPPGPPPNPRTAKQALGSSVYSPGEVKGTTDGGGGCSGGAASAIYPVATVQRAGPYICAGNLNIESIDVRAEQRVPLNPEVGANLPTQNPYEVQQGLQENMDNVNDSFNVFQNVFRSPGRTPGKGGNLMFATADVSNDSASVVRYDPLGTSVDTTVPIRRVNSTNADMLSTVGFAPVASIKRTAAPPTSFYVEGKKKLANVYLHCPDMGSTRAPGGAYVNAPSGEDWSCKIESSPSKIERLHGGNMYGNCRIDACNHPLVPRFSREGVRVINSAANDLNVPAGALYAVMYGEGYAYSKVFVPGGADAFHKDIAGVSTQTVSLLDDGSVLGESTYEDPWEKYKFDPEYGNGIKNYWNADEYVLNWSIPWYGRINVDGYPNVCSDINWSAEGPYQMLRKWFELAVDNTGAGIALNVLAAGRGRYPSRCNFLDASYVAAGILANATPADGMCKWTEEGARKAFLQYSGGSYLQGVDTGEGDVLANMIDIVKKCHGIK